MKPKLALAGAIPTLTASTSRKQRTTQKKSGASADSTKAQALVAKLQAHITANYYTCTDEILAGLGKMYVADERFKKNIDKYGEGTAEFAAEAIKVSGGKNL